MVMGSKRISSIWRHFSAEKDRKVSCLTCGQRLSIANKSTYGLIRHIKSKHYAKIVESKRKGRKNQDLGDLLQRVNDLSQDRNELLDDRKDLSQDVTKDVNDPLNREEAANPPAGSDIKLGKDFDNLKEKLTEEKQPHDILEWEKISVIKKFYERENERANAKHELQLRIMQETHEREMRTLDLKNELLQLEVVEKRNRLGMFCKCSEKEGSTTQRVT